MLMSTINKTWREDIGLGRTLTLGTYGVGRLRSANPSQLNPSNHLCFCTSFTPAPP